MIFCEHLQRNHLITFSMINVTAVYPTIDNNRKDAPLCTQMDNVSGLSPTSSLRNVMVTI